MYSSSNTKVFLNGNFLPAKDAQASLFGQSLHYGSGIFEGIRSYNTEEGTRVFKTEEYYQRLMTSLFERPNPKSCLF